MKNALVIICLLLATQIMAQYPPVNGYWEGTWGDNFPFNTYLETQADGVSIKATITWFFGVEENSHTIQAKEFLEGTYDSKTGLLLLHTVGEEDPDGRLVSGYYQMKLEPSGTLLIGFTMSTPTSVYKTPMRMSREGA